MGWGRLLRLRWVLGVLLGFSGVAAALSLSPEVQHGVTWLQSRISDSGSLGGEADSVATPLQNRDEALRTLQLLASGSPQLAAGVAGEDPSATESLARQALSLGATRDIGTLLQALAGRQNTDGGIGATAGGPSNALDSAWALAALSQQPALYGQAIVGLKTYLLGQQWQDGGLAGLSQTSRLEGSSLLLLALQALTPDVATRDGMQKLSTWLSQSQGADGAWGSDLYITAYALAALTPVSSDGTQRQAAVSYLKSQQGPNGDWANDPFLTAVILRALSATPGTATPTVTNSVFGQVLSSAGNLPLSGVAVALDGSSKATTTGTDGKFQLNGVPTSSQILRLSLAGYQDRTFTITVPSTTQLNLGTVMLSPVSAAVTTLSGTVLDIDTQQAVAGATVALGGGATLSVQTDAAGKYQFSNLAAGTYSLSLSAGGYTTQSFSISLGEGGNLLPLTLRKQSNPTPIPTGPATLSGQVVALGSNQPLADVQILVNQQPITATSGTGAFALTLPAGSYRLDYLKAGYFTLTQNVAVTEGSTVSIGQVTLTAQRNTTRLSGLVLDRQTQQPLANATVQVVDGASTSTGSDGRYALDDIAATEFDVRVSAAGYDSELTRLSVSFPGEVAYDFSLAPQVGQGVSIAPLEISPASIGLRTDVVLAATYRNAGSEGAELVPTLQLLDGAGKVVSAAVPYATPQASTPVSSVTVAAGGSLTLYFRWNSGQFPPGGYSALARGSLVGTISRSNLLGTVLAERQGGFAITAGQHLVGSLTATPPVQQAGNVQPVHLSAVIQNDGNTPAAAQTLTVRLVNEKSGTAAATLTGALPALDMNGLATVDFGDWSSPVPGSYIATVVDEYGTAMGLSTKVYVGDAAKGFFTVNKTVVPTGTQSVKANVALQGVDAVTGEITDPLAPLIKTAIQKAVTYNDTAAAAWVATNKCGGCHLAAQAIVGGESNNNLTYYDQLKRKQVIGQVVALQESGTGGWLHDHALTYSRTQASTSMWGLSSVQDKTDILGTYSKGIQYLLDVQGGGGAWSADHDSGLHWWSTLLGMTSINVHSLLTYANMLRADPGLTYSWFKPWTDYGSITSAGASLRFDANRNLYVSGYNYVEKITPAGVRETVLRNFSDIRQVLPRPNGDLYACALNGGLIKKSADGTVKVLYSGAMWGIQASAAGDIYVSSHTNGAIYKLVNDQLVFYASTPQIHHFAFGRDGNIYYTRWGSDAITRITPDGVQTQVGRYPYGIYVSQLLQLPNGNWAVSGTYGVFLMDETFSRVISNVISVNSYGLEQLDGKLLFSRSDTGGGHTVQQYTSGFSPAALNVPARLDPALQKSKAWLLSTTASSYYWVQESALQMIALAELQEYFGPDPAIAAKLQQLNTALRAAQTSNGSWGFGYGGANDPLLTAQVGYALDKLNPSADDPVIRKAIQWMLSAQAADGSWYSSQLSTRASTTTWVAIWLPIALNRVGGIDTDLHLTLPATAHLSNANPAPTETTAGSDGTHYRWSFTGVTSTGRNVGFDLTLDNLAPNEQRAVASDAHLAFSNSFTNSEVTAPLDVPVVTASNGLALTLATDQASYGANAPVQISASVGNNSQLIQDGSVHLWVYAQDGTLVSDLGAQPFNGLAAAGTTALNGSWNTGLYLPNSYYVLGTLLDANGLQVSTQRQDFVIVSATATGRLLGAQVSTDKGSYGPWDTVQLTDRVSNLTQNALVGELQLTTQITAAATNEVVWTHQDVISQLTAGSLQDLAFSVPLHNAAAGSYTVTLTVKDKNGVVQAQSSASYVVQSTASTGAGLSGTLALSKKLVVKGDTETISVTVSNQGNATLNALPVTVSIIDPVSNTLVTQWQDTVPALAQAGTANLAHGWTTQGSYGQNLVAVLTTGLTGSRALAQGVFTLTKPPVTLTYASDKPVYDVNDTAQLASTVSNGAPISLAHLTLTQQVLRPDGSELWSGLLPEQGIAVGGTLAHSDPLALGRNPAGHYSATLTVRDSDGIVLATTATGFDLRSSALSGAGLVGMVTATPQEVPQGESATLAFSVGNQGNADFSNLPLQLVIRATATGQVVKTFSITLPQLLQETTQSQSVAWASTAQGAYTVALVATVNGSARQLAATSLQVVAPPVKLSVEQQWGGQGRVLVYLSCQPDWQKDVPAWKYGDHKHACFAARTATLKSYLDALGVTYTIVVESDDFQREFRSGRYTSYWLLGAVETLSHGTLEELREAVHRGDSLVADGGIQRWNNADLYPLLGLTYKGQLACTNASVRFTAPVYGAALAAYGPLATRDRPLDVQVSTGSASAAVAGGSCDGATAAVAGHLGRGATLGVSFDLVGSLPTATPAPAWLEMLRETLAYTRPADTAPSALVPGDYLRHVLTLTNEAKAVNLVATVTLPAGAGLVGTVPAATVNADGSLRYSVTLPADAMQVLDTQFRAPLLAGNYSVATTLRVAGQDGDYGAYSLPFTVLDGATRASQVRVAVNNLAVPAKSADLNLQKQALAKLDLALQHYAQGKLGTAIGELGDAGELLGQMTQTPVTEARVALDYLLRDWEGQWWRECGLLPAAQREPARCAP